MMNTKPLMVLFLSTGNAARSILAEALLRHKGSSRFTARSAGFRSLPAVHPQTLSLLKAEGLSTDGLHSKGWGEFMASAHIIKIDVIVTLSEDARTHCPQWFGNPVRVHWPVDDPLSAEKEDVREWKFRKCFGTLETRIHALLKSRTAQSPMELLMQLKDIGMVV
ncbi:MAG: arsenate reductase ArsC [Pseudomonadota bacterium]|nr:arsenate reductase ArsC [Pseudomonadota bacterium]